MGNVNLGLDDRSARLIHGRDVWSKIGNLLSGYRRISAAIGHVGSDADQYLSLRGPATIVVNASDEALADGSTDPQLLLRWTRRGVRIYSLASLHAKVVLAEGDPSFVLVGSANASWSSANRLDEAVLVADEKETVAEMRAAIDDWKRRAGDPLTEEWLQEAVGRAGPAVPRQPPAAQELEVGLAPAVRAAPEPVPEPESVIEPEPVWQPERVREPEPACQPDPVREPVRVPEPVREPEPGEPERVREPEPVGELEPVGEPHVAGAPEVDESAFVCPPVSSGPQAQEPSPAALRAPVGRLPPAEEPRAVVWTRPKYIYLALLSTEGRASESAEEQLAALRSEFRAPDATSDRTTLDVQMFWSNQPANSGRAGVSYRPGWHVVAISVPASGRPAMLSRVDSPGRVLHSFTDYLANPTRTYYYLLTHSAGPSINFRKLRERLSAVGEKPSYDHAYMMQHKVDAILGLWPEIAYTD